MRLSFPENGKCRRQIGGTVKKYIVRWQTAISEKNPPVVHL
jgi:hypothetical protein